MGYNKLLTLDGKSAKRANEITAIDPGSPAEDLDIQVGDFLIAINDTPIKDILDYRYLTAAEDFKLTLQRGEDEISLSVDKEPYEDLGLNFATGLMDRASCCSNKCVFCFIDQLPKGMRDSLYFKDDDSRLAFLQGNFVTLTNMTDEDIQRIIDYKISPINISVHATEGGVRVKLLKNPKAADLWPRLKKLAAGGIQMNAQIVLVPGYNDGLHLDKTLRDLAGLYPQVGAVAIVPLGLTKHRQGLEELTPFDKASAGRVLDQVSILQAEFSKELGTVFARCADEFYCLAQAPIPGEDFYEGYGQLEDGIGMIRLFRESVRASLPDLEPKQMAVTFFTGTSAYKEIAWAARLIRDQSGGMITTNAYAIENNFFGTTITVAGLLTGQDIVAQLKDQPVHPLVIMPRNMLRTGEAILLDNWTLEELEEALQAEIRLVDYTGEDLIETLNNYAKDRR